MSALDFARVFAIAAARPHEARALGELGARVAGAAEAIAAASLAPFVRLELDTAADAIAAEPMEAHVVAAAITALERAIASARSRVAASRAAPEALDPSLAALLVSVGRPTNRSPCDSRSIFGRAIAELLESATGLAAVMLEGLRSAARRELDELDLQRIAFLVERRILRAPDPAIIAAPRFQLGLLPALRLAGNESIAPGLAPLLAAARLPLPARPLGRAAERQRLDEQTTGDRTAARRQGLDEAAFKAIEERHEAAIRASLEREASDDRRWVADVSTILARLDVALQAVAGDTGAALVTRIAADHVRRHLRAAPMHARWELEDAAREIVERVDLIVPAEAPPSVEPMIAGVVSTARGIERRSRAGYTFTSTGTRGEWPASTWQIFERDDGLIATRVDAAAPNPAPDRTAASDAAATAKIAELEAERARLRRELEARAGKDAKDGRPTRLARKSKDAAGDDFGGGAA